MASEVVAPREYGLGTTQRRDVWWAGPLVTGLVLGGFVVYSTFRACYNAEYHLGHGTDVLPEHAYLLSPFYSPLLVFPRLPALLSPASLIIWARGGFRLPCYYYLKHFYRSLLLDP